MWVSLAVLAGCVAFTILNVIVLLTYPLSPSLHIFAIRINGTALVILGLVAFFNLGKEPRSDHLFGNMVLFFALATISYLSNLNVVMVWIGMVTNFAIFILLSFEALRQTIEIHRENKKRKNLSMLL